MGVSGSHKLLQPYAATKHVSDYRGLRLGVDGYSWLHRAAASCAEDLFHGRDTTKLVQSIDNRIRLYEHHGVESFFVFDGASLGMKSEIEKQRREKRKQAQAASKAGKQASYYNILSSVEITAHHAAMVIASLKQRQIKYVVAPFEADSQLVWLEKEGFVQGIISEDSDMLVFGAQRLLTKSDPVSGKCIESHAPQFPKHYQSLSFLRALAIISGCDYCPGVHGLGPIKAGNLLQKYGGQLEAVMESLSRERRVEEAFIAMAKKADLAFQYQRVWDVQNKALTHLNDVTELEGDPRAFEMITEEVVGRELSRIQAQRIATGIVDPHNFSTELVVSPSVTQYVNRCRPFTMPKPTALSSPLAVSRAIDRRLSTPATQSKKVSPFFRNQSDAKFATSDNSNKENVLYAAKVASTPQSNSAINTYSSSQGIKSFFRPVSPKREQVPAPTSPVSPKREQVLPPGLPISRKETSSPVSATADTSFTAVPPIHIPENDASFTSVDSAANETSNDTSSLNSSPSISAMSASTASLARRSFTVVDSDEFQFTKRQRTLEDAPQIKILTEDSNDCEEVCSAAPESAWISESSEPEDAGTERFAFLRRFEFKGSVN